MTAAIAALSLAIWLYLLLGRGGFWRMLETPAPKLAAGALPDVAAVVPARNEADVVGQAIASLAAQRYGGRFGIVLVDDGSDDGTAAVAAEAGAEILRIVQAGPLVAGWTGKMWAVQAGVWAAGSPEWLLLTDADIAHPPEHVADLMARALEGGYDIVSSMVRLRCQSPAEQALIPAFVFFFFLLYPPRWIRDQRRATAGAAGGCILIRREALERIGGIARIRAEVIDDCSLAAAVKSSGGRVWLGLRGDATSIRPYGSFAEIGRMISRTAFTQLRYSAWLLAGTIGGLALTYLAPPVMTLWTDGWPRAMAAAAWLIMTLMYLQAVRYYRQPWWWAPLLPAIAVFYMGATVWSAIAYWRGRGGMWKGRAAASAG